MSNKNNTYKKYPNTSKALAAGIRSKRKANGISQFELSESTGLSRNCIQQMECFEHLPKLDTVFGMMLELRFSEEESKDFIWECLNAYREDKELQKEPAGAT